MKILIIGSGGREHALAWKLGQSEKVDEIILMPGNSGAELSPKVRNIKCDPSNRIELLKKLTEIQPELTIVGPEKFLGEGIVDFIEDQGHTVFGPSQLASALECSKIFSKNFMFEHDIPTAKFESYASAELALASLDDWDLEKGIVLKADELASGKGVVVTHSRIEAEKVIDDFMLNPDCSVKTGSLLIEEKLIGKEVSAFAICDGENFVELGYICDYKAVKDGGVGPNTGGMGCYAPKNWPSDTCKDFIRERVFAPVLKGMKEAGTPFKGVLFAGLMVAGDRAQVIEFNVRFGDPETQTLLPLIEGDFVSLLMAAAKGDLSGARHLIRLNEKTAVHVVMASGGYPSIDKTPLSLGHSIQFDKKLMSQKDISLFFAGVKKQDQSELVNSGGRVLGVTALGESIDEARLKAYGEIKKISFTNSHWRTDIGL